MVEREGCFLHALNGRWSHLVRGRPGILRPHSIDSALELQQSPLKCPANSTTMFSSTQPSNPSANLSENRTNRSVIRTQFLQTGQRMCIKPTYIHPSCGHRANGTAAIPPVVDYCRAVWDDPIGPDWLRQCTEWNGLEHRDRYVSRGYCDRCIMTGVQVMRCHGMEDLDTYARSMGVSLHELMEANPGWRPDR